MTANAKAKGDTIAVKQLLELAKVALMIVTAQMGNASNIQERIGASVV
jgi:hypothetical protein